MRVDCFPGGLSGKTGLLCFAWKKTVSSLRAYDLSAQFVAKMHLGLPSSQPEDITHNILPLIHAPQPCHTLTHQAAVCYGAFPLS
ncbi:hypothetical protein AVEN_236100-1 [Araneus ventricosus]|uniref:Uncharacterized protein n=1 Tax=Araneus ventricosus TaxID=182803 RepID=A0A4Y2HJP9_ARAVE|nr:hypothetical protein AVEN_236100-1 [Araneus ventricosus]